MHITMSKLSLLAQQEDKSIYFCRQEINHVSIAFWSQSLTVKMFTAFQEGREREKKSRVGWTKGASYKECGFDNVNRLSDNFIIWCDINHFCLASVWLKLFRPHLFLVFFFFSFSPCKILYYIYINFNKNDNNFAQWQGAAKFTFMVQSTTRKNDPGYLSAELNK